MSERELAIELQNSKGDEDDWEAVSTDKAAPRKAAKRRLAAMVSIRLTPEELELIQDRARESDQSVSAYIRRLALRGVADRARSTVVGGSRGYSTASNKAPAQPIVCAHSGHAYSISGVDTLAS